VNLQGQNRPTLSFVYSPSVPNERKDWPSVCNLFRSENPATGDAVRRFGSIEAWNGGRMS
jgi:hypothetical protein